MIHGESRSNSKQLTPEEIKQKQEKAEKINFHICNFLESRKNLSQLPKESLLEMTFNLAQMSPEIYTIYNVRRELLSKSLEEIAESPNKCLEILIKELDLINYLLKKQPKSYSLFTHRQWVISQAHKEEIKEKVEISNGLIVKELGFCAKMLERDERNFHVWNYRNWLIELGEDIHFSKKEIAFTKSKIEQNFTNFSSLHFRAVNFLRYYEKYLKICENSSEKEEIITFRMPLKIISEELEFISTGLFMQTNEQGIWQYHRWLLELLLPIYISQIIYLEEESEQSKFHIFLIVFSTKVKNFLLDQLEIKANQIILQGDPSEINIANLNNIDFSRYYALRIHKDLIKSCDKLIIQGKNVTAIENGKFLQDINRKRCFLASSFEFIHESSKWNLISFDKYSEKDKEMMAFSQKLFGNSMKNVDEILTLEKNNKFVLLEKNYLIENNKKTFFDEKANAEILKNLNTLKENYDKQRNMFQRLSDFYEAILDIEKKIKNNDFLANDIKKYSFLERFEEILASLVCDGKLKWEELSINLK